MLGHTESKLDKSLTFSWLRIYVCHHLDGGMTFPMNQWGDLTREAYTSINLQKIFYYQKIFQYLVPMEQGSKLTYLTDGKRHLICVPYSIENLHRMARELGIGRWWFHKNHYDIPQFTQEAVERKCKKIDTREIVEIIRHPEYGGIIIEEEVWGNACPRDYFMMTDLEYRGYR